MTPQHWSEFNIATMIVNACIATLWAFASWDIARRRDVFLQWPLPWRWLVSNWFWAKAALFWAITLALFAVLPFGVGELVLSFFTVCHIWAFWRWLHLPEPGDEPPCDGPPDGPMPH